MIALLFAIFIGVWGTMLLAGYLKAERQLGEGTPDDQTMRLQEEVESLTRRLEIVEDELSFFKELRAPESESGGLRQVLPPADENREP